MKKELSFSPLTNRSTFDFNRNWDWFIQPYIHLLMANVHVGSMREDMTDAQFADAFTHTEMAKLYTHIDSCTEGHVAQLLKKYGFQNHISGVLPLLPTGN